MSLNPPWPPFCKGGDAAVGHRLRRCRGIVFTVLATVILVGSDPVSMAAEAPVQLELPAPQSMPVVGDPVKGKKVAEQCADCHGLDGVRARSGAPFIAGLQQPYLVRSLLAYRNGARVHEAMQQASEALNPITLADVTAYYAGLETPWRGAVAGQASKAILQDADARRAAEHIVDACRSCHIQLDRFQRQQAIPTIDGMPMEYFVPALKSYVNGERHNEIMAQFKGSLSERDIYNLAAYFAARKPKQAPPMGVGDPARGKRAAQACAGCHGYDGNSLNPHIPNLAGQSARYLVKAIRDYREGVRESPLMRAPVKQLSNATIADLAAYYSRQRPQSPLHRDLASPRAFDPLADGQAIAASCNSCHGEQGNSHTAGVPSLTGQHVRYLTRATQAYQQGERGHPAMQEIVSFFSDTDIEKAAYWYALQPPQASGRPGPGDAARGEALSEACAGCHGAQGISPDPAATPSLAGQDGPYLIQATRAYANGARLHEGMADVAKGLDTQALQDLAAYYAGQTPQPVTTYLPTDPQQLVQQRCSRCHGERGYANRPGVPRLAGQLEPYLVLALKQYQQGTRKDSTMIAMADVLSLLEIKAMAAYYAKQ